MYIDNFTSNEYQYDFTLGENDVFTNKLEDIMEFIASSTNDYQNEYKYQDEQIMFTDSLKSLSNDELKGILNACKPGEKRYFFKIN